MLFCKHNNNNLRLLSLKQTAQPTVITTACHAGQQQGLARGIAAKYNGDCHV